MYPGLTVYWRDLVQNNQIFTTSFLTSKCICFSDISPAENLGVAIIALGEGWHNYHHTFPWDYKTAELGRYSVNLTAFWIDVFAKLGLAYDLKTASNDLIEAVVKKKGDGSHPKWGSTDAEESHKADWFCWLCWMFCVTHIFVIYLFTC